MRSLVFMFIYFTTFMTYAYPDNVADEAIKAVNLKCNVTFNLQNIDEIEQVDSGHDYATYSVFFKSGESVSVTQTFDGGKQVSFWVDEVYCN
jgi:hypothetical protein